MSELIWDDTLSIQIEEIDEDHRRLIELFNMLNNSITASETSEYIAALLEELISYTVWHFRHEERLMLKYGYKGLEEHRSEHRELIESARELQQKFLNRGGALSAEEIEFLERWLTGHILGADMDMSSYLSKLM